MVIGDWITLSAVIVALGIGVASIVQTQTLQKRERKERLLSEIIVWADDIRKSSSENIDPSKVILDSPVMQMATQDYFIQLRKRYQAFKTKSAYIKEAISKVFGGDLLSSVNRVIQELDNNIELLRVCLTQKGKDNIKEVENCKKSLDSSSEELMILATKIKTKDIR